MAGEGTAPAFSVALTSAATGFAAVNCAVSGGPGTGGEGGAGEAKIPKGDRSRCGTTLGAFGGLLITRRLVTGVGGAAGGMKPRISLGRLAGRSTGVRMTAGRITRGASGITTTRPVRSRWAGARTGRTR
jgi:hypothetical protein